MDDDQQEIFITDLAANQTIGLQGTVRGASNPIWSPDSSQIVFNRGGDIYVVHVDASNMRRLASKEWQVSAIGWMPHGSRLVFPDHTLDVQNGKTDYFLNEELLAMSPDAKYKITVAREPENKQVSGFYFSNMNGSNRWGLFDVDILIRNPIWSADGEWLLVSFSKVTFEKYTPTFIHLKDCKIFPLPKLNGIVLSWLP